MTLKQLIKNVAAVSALTLASMSANAGLITGHTSFDDQGTYTVDTSASLEWLDLTETRNLSYSTVAASSLVTVDGWKFATSAQFHNLIESWFNVNYPVSNNGRLELTDSDPSNGDSVEEFIALFGDTSGTAAINGSWGWQPAQLGQGSSAGFLALSGNAIQSAFVNDKEEVHTDGSTRDAKDEVQTFLPNNVDLYSTKTIWGSWLVRDYVAEASDKQDIPEPSTLAIFGLALLGLSLSRKKA